MKKKITFKIEKGIPIPPVGAKGMSGRESLVDWPFKRMEKGDSVLVPFQYANAASVRLPKDGFTREEFTSRKVPGGVRIWRLK